MPHQKHTRLHERSYSEEFSESEEVSNNEIVGKDQRFFTQVNIAQNNEQPKYFPIPEGEIKEDSGCLSCLKAVIKFLK